MSPKLFGWAIWSWLITLLMSAVVDGVLSGYTLSHLNGLTQFSQFHMKEISWLPVDVPVMNPQFITSLSGMLTWNFSIFEHDAMRWLRVIVWLTMSGIISLGAILSVGPIVLQGTGLVLQGIAAITSFFRRF